MDASMMSSMAGSGMDMSSSGMFLPQNQSLARAYWYLIAACALIASALKVTDFFISWSRRKTRRTLSISHPTRPRNAISQTYATAVAICRELSYPQIIHFSFLWMEWLTPPPLGRLLAILIYWVIMTLFLTTGSIVHDAYYWERIAFRAAWISVTQVPLVYLLAGKFNVLGILFGSAYVDLNWVHRWVSRTLFVTVTIHGGCFITEWIRADFFQTEMSMMPMVKWGLGAWGILAWSAISSLIPLRRLCYELFVLQHLASAGIFLWLLYKHVPSYAAYNIWMAVAFVVSGRVLRGCIFLFRSLAPRRTIGYAAELQAMPGEITAVTIRDVGFEWKAAQHVLVWCPTLGPLESHPFTISNISHDEHNHPHKNLELVVRARSGFTRRLHRRALSSHISRYPQIRAFITGPFGNTPTWNTFETLILISASTGASFTLPILESVLNDPCCVTRIEYLLLVRDSSHLDAYISRLKAALTHSQASRVDLRIQIAVTGEEDEKIHEGNGEKHARSLSSSTTSTSSEAASTTLLPSQTPKPTSTSTSPHLSPSQPPPTTSPPSLIYTHHRPSLSTYIRSPIESSAGETLVVVCGGKGLTSTVRNAVAALSDERAVHKGTGAQGIRLWVEGFGS